MESVATVAGQIVAVERLNPVSKQGRPDDLYSLVYSQAMTSVLHPHWTGSGAYRPNEHCAFDWIYRRIHAFLWQINRGFLITESCVKYASIESPVYNAIIGLEGVTR